MNSQPQNELISVALCTYNGALYLEDQLFSIVNQSYKNLEIIILDDCSEDDTIAIIENFQEADSRIKLYRNEKNIGFNQNFLNAIGLCSANYIALSDQDDIWMLDKIDRMISQIGDNLLFYHNSAYINEQDELNGRSTLSAHRFVKGYCSRELLLNNCVAGHACLIKKELIALVPAIPANFYYDWWLAYTAACVGRIGFTNEILVKYRLHQHSITQNDKKRSRLNRMNNFAHLQSHSSTPKGVRLYIGSLLTNYYSLISDRFSLRLFFLLLTNYNSIFYTRKRSVFSNLVFLVKESIN